MENIPTHYDLLSKEQQATVINELVGHFEPWEILHGTYEFDEDGDFQVIHGSEH